MQLYFLFELRVELQPCPLLAGGSLAQEASGTAAAAPSPAPAASGAALPRNVWHSSACSSVLRLWAQGFQRKRLAQLWQQPVQLQWRLARLCRALSGTALAAFCLSSRSVWRRHRLAKLWPPRRSFGSVWRSSGTSGRLGFGRGTPSQATPTKHDYIDNVYTNAKLIGIRGE